MIFTTYVYVVYNLPRLIIEMMVSKLGLIIYMGDQSRGIKTPVFGWGPSGYRLLDAWFIIMGIWGNV